MHIEHPVLEPETVAFRGYQANLARMCREKDTLVVLPTGMGKTIVALLALADSVRDGAKRVLIMAPTKPLVEQHGRFLESVLRSPWKEQVHVLTGSVSPEKRETAYKGEGFVCATPQVVRNDILNGRLAADAFDWIVFDECHRASGDYPYTFIGEEVRRTGRKVRRMGLTASPGHDATKIDAVRVALGLEHVEIRTPTDPDVRDYVQDVEVEWEPMPLPPGMAAISQKLHSALAERVRALKGLGFLKNAPSRPRRMDLLECAKRAQTMIQNARDPEPSLFQALSLQAQAMKIQHAIEQAETQGANGLVAYLEGVIQEASGPKASKATRNVAEDPAIVEAMHLAKRTDEDNPKLERTVTLVQETLESSAESRIIVFTQYRSTCQAIADRLSRVAGVRPVVFVGQGKRRAGAGLTQKQQAETIQAFAEGQHNVLVATSVAEEGLDIPQTDLVVFFEPIGSEIRSIQRRGRTGRNRSGRVVVLMTKGTQDEAAHWTAKRRERQMVQELHTLRATLAGRPRETAPGQTRLGDAPKAEKATKTQPAAQEAPRALMPGPKIVADSREQHGGVAEHLHKLGAQVEARRLDIADYVLSDRVAVERKSTTDFVDSLVDGRLFTQLQELRTYPKAFLVIEGRSLHGHRQVSPEALLGALASIAVDYGIPAIRTEDGLETARFLLAVAKREQTRDKRPIAVRPATPGKSQRDAQRFLIEGLPGVSASRAEALLQAFGSVGAVFAGSEDALAAVDGIGAKTAKEIRRILDAPYALTLDRKG